MIRTALLAFSVLALTTSVSLAAGDANAGKGKAALCISCHGLDGNGSPSNAEWPALAGQHASYTADQIRAFQEGTTRSNLIMQPMIAGLTEQDIEDVAAYYESLPRRIRFADENARDEIAFGERLYRGGNIERGIPACMGCHGPAGTGNGPAGFPALANQTAEYTAIQLNLFKSGERSNDKNMMMQDVAAKLSSEDIQALSKYLAGLH